MIYVMRALANDIINRTWCSEYINRRRRLELSLSDRHHIDRTPYSIVPVGFVLLCVGYKLITYTRVRCA